MNTYFNPLKSMPPVVKNLLIINVIVWLFTVLFPTASHTFTKYMALYYFTSPGFQVWQLITYQFLHSGFTHLFFNMFALVVFGTVIERTMGSARFLAYYLICGIGAALVQEGVFAAMIAHYASLIPPEQYHYVLEHGWQVMMNGQNYADPTLGALNAYINTPMMGASGAVYGVILAFGMIYPNVPLYIWFVPIPIKAKWLVIGYAVLELSLGIGVSADGVAHFAHLGGMLFGLILILYWRRRGVFRNHWFF